MLAERVLEELTRNTPLREKLVTLAWPSLTVESKLQILDAIQQGAFSSTPIWLAKIAIEDDAAVVRYWAAKRTYFERPSASEPLAIFGFQRPQSSPETFELSAKVDADQCDFVRMVATISKGLFACEMLTSLPQTQRLLTIRHWSSPSLLQFVEWLETAVAVGVNDQELQECAEEFFAHPQTKHDLKRKRMDFYDGYDAYQCCTGMEKGWALLHKCGPALLTVMVSSLPTSYGLGGMKVEDLAALPERALGYLIYLYDPSPEVVALIMLMRSNPERFPSEVIKSLNRKEENSDGQDISVERIEVMRRSQSVTKSQETLEVVLEIKQTLAELQEEQKEQMAKPKRGFFN